MKGAWNQKARGTQMRVYSCRLSYTG